MPAALCIATGRSLPLLRTREGPLRRFSSSAWNQTFRSNGIELWHVWESRFIAIISRIISSGKMANLSCYWILKTIKILWEKITRFWFIILICCNLQFASSYSRINFWLLWERICKLSLKVSKQILKTIYLKYRINCTISSSRRKMIN